MLITMLHYFIYYPLRSLNPRYRISFWGFHLHYPNGIFLAFPLNQLVFLHTFILQFNHSFFSVCQNHIQNTSSLMVTWFLPQFILDPVSSYLPNTFLKCIIPTALYIRFLLPYPNLNSKQESGQNHIIINNHVSFVRTTFIPCNSSPFLPLFVHLKISPFTFL